MPVFEFAIESTVADNTAFTVLTALHGLGYRDLSRVERSELLRLEPHAAGVSNASIEVYARCLTGAEVVFNPNKHRLSYAVGGAGSDSFEAVVLDKDDDTESLRELLVGRFGMPDVARIERATAWRLYEAEREAPPARLRWACETLLANPFSQTFEVRPRPAYARAKRSTASSA